MMDYIQGAVSVRDAATHKTQKYVWRYMFK